MKAYIDIENSKTQEVITLCVNIIKYERNKEAIFDISTLSNNEISILKDAINDELLYTDIEMFFVDDSNIPNFGPDYKYEIVDDSLTLKYIRKNTRTKTQEKNEDWTIYFEEEFQKIANDFIKTDFKYLLIYNDGCFKSEFIKNKPKDSIFMDLFFDKKYNMIALFKKRKNVNSTNVRDCLEYIDSYCENEKFEEKCNL